MATPAAEQARMRALLEAEDRALERDTRGAQAQVRRAAAQIAREGRRSGGGGGASAARLMRNAWRRPPSGGLSLSLGRLFRASRSRPSRIGKDGKRYVTFHFAVGQSSSKQGSRRHQSHIERPGD